MIDNNRTLFVLRQSERGGSVADHVIGVRQAAAGWTMSRTARQQVRQYSEPPASRPPASRAQPTYDL